MPALGAAMAESALSNFPHVRRAFVDFNKRAVNAGSAFCRVRRAFVDLGTVLLCTKVRVVFNAQNCDLFGKEVILACLFSICMKMTA